MQVRLRSYKWKKKNNLESSLETHVHGQPFPATTIPRTIQVR